MIDEYPAGRYHNAVDGTGNEMRNLLVPIRIVFSTVGTLQEEGKQVGDRPG